MHRFQREQRLIRKADYDKVFEQPFFKFGNQHLLVLVRYRNEGGEGRLGLIASKKHLKCSVARNRFKRQAREAFRTYQPHLAECDVLVMSRAKSLECPSLFHELTGLWPKVAKRRQKIRPARTEPDEQVTPSP